MLLFLLGISAGKVAGDVFSLIWRRKKVDEFLEKHSLPKDIAGVKLRYILSTIISLSIAIFLFSEGFKLLNLSVLSNFLISVLAFFPNLLRILFVLYLGIIILRRAGESIKQVPYGHILYLPISAVVYLFLGGIILKEIGIPEATILIRIVEILVWGCSAGVAMIIGIFGYLYLKRYLKEKE